jgi:MarR family transcriptional regulator, organic hydroperoxide resistance regulator
MIDGERQITLASKLIGELPMTTGLKSGRRVVAAAEPALATVSRPALLVDGGDGAFRAMIHALLSFSHHVESVRDGFGALIGVSGAQYEVLMSVQRLQGSRGVAVGDVAAWMQRSGAFITIEAGKLVRLGLVEKTVDARDRRRVLLRLTQAAHARLAALAPTQVAANDQLFAALETRDFAALSRTLERLLPCGAAAAALMGTIAKEGKNTAWP